MFKIHVIILLGTTNYLLLDFLYSEIVWFYPFLSLKSIEINVYKLNIFRKGQKICLATVRFINIIFPSFVNTSLTKTVHVIISSDTQGQWLTFSQLIIFPAQ